jgi:hypothetical protein
MFRQAQKAWHRNVTTKRDRQQEETGFRYSGENSLTPCGSRELTARATPEDRAGGVINQILAGLQRKTYQSTRLFSEARP